MKLSPFLLASVLSASVAWGAIDFFGLPEKIVVPKSVAATPAPATPAPIRATPPPSPPSPAPPPRADGDEPTLTSDGAFLKTPVSAGERAISGGFYDVGPDRGVLIGFQYTLGQSDRDGSFIESLTPLFLRAAGKATGITRGNRSAKSYVRVLEAKPGYAIGSVDARGTRVLEALRVVFMRYENGTLDSSDSYTGEWIGERGERDGPNTVHLRTDKRPFAGIYGKATRAIDEFGLLVRRESAATIEPPEPPGRGDDPEGVKKTTPPPGTIEVLACGNESYTLYLNGREILAGNDRHDVQSGYFAVVKGDVFCAVVKDNSAFDLWFSLRVVRDGTTILDAGDMLYQTHEPPSWKTNRLTTGFREPRITTHRRRVMGSDTTRAARPDQKDSSATTLYLKGVIQR